MTKVNKTSPEESEEAGAQLSEIEEQLKERGFQSVEDLLADRDKTAEERDGFKDKNDNAQKLIQRQGAELGDLRKTHKPKKGENTETVNAEVDEETLEEIKASLSPVQRERADAVYQSLPDEEPDQETGLSKAELANNSELLKDFFLTARQEVKEIPKSLFSGKPQETADQSNEKIKELFTTNKERSNFTPTGSRTGPSRTRAGDESQAEGGSARPLRNGVLDRIQREGKE